MTEVSVLTISGVPGSGTTTIARLLAEKLNLKMIYIGEIFRELAKEHKMTLEEFGEYADDNPEIDRKLDERQLEYGKLGNIVLEGRLSGCVMRINNINAFKVLLTADLEERIKRVMGRENKGYEQVREEIEAREELELERYKKIYNLNYLDISVYDLVIDTTDMSPEEIVIKIIEEFRNKQNLESDQDQ